MSSTEMRATGMQGTQAHFYAGTMATVRPRVTDDAY